MSRRNIPSLLREKSHSACHFGFQPEDEEYCMVHLRASESSRNRAWSSGPRWPVRYRCTSGVHSIASPELVIDNLNSLGGAGFGPTLNLPATISAFSCSAIFFPQLSYIQEIDISKQFHPTSPNYLLHALASQLNSGAETRHILNDLRQELNSCPDTCL